MAEPLDLDAIKACWCGKWHPETMVALVAEVERLRSERTVTREDVAEAMDLARDEGSRPSGGYERGNP